MAYVLTIRGFSKTDGRELFYVEPFWWKNDEFTKDSRVKEVTDEGFDDYEANLSAEELRQIHEKFKPYADDDWYKTGISQNLIKQRMEALDFVTGEGADQFSHFIAGLYEWDSGM
jgi:hypothetical protein